MWSARRKLLLESDRRHLGREEANPSTRHDSLALGKATDCSCTTSKTGSCKACNLAKGIRCRCSRRFDSVGHWSFRSAIHAIMEYSQPSASNQGGPYSSYHMEDVGFKISDRRFKR